MIVVSVPVFALFVLLEAAALLIAILLTFPGLLARLEAATARKPAPADAWILIEHADGTIAAWPFHEQIPSNCTVHDPAPYTRAEIEAMAQN
jgi:hypothetical protein